MSKNIFGEEEVDRIVFRPVNLDMAGKVKKVSDPAPRPLPQPIDDETKAKEWIPGSKNRRKKNKNPDKESSVDLTQTFTFVKYAFFTLLALGCLTGIVMLVSWVFQQYNISL